MTSSDWNVCGRGGNSLWATLDGSAWALHQRLLTCSSLIRLWVIFGDFSENLGNLPFCRTEIIDYGKKMKKGSELNITNNLPGKSPL
jgi:hypothetical protein